jgi:hypothetical protein
MFSRKKKPVIDRLIEKTTKIVNLLWNGNDEPFEIYEVNFMELMGCGKFPNLLATFVSVFSKDKEDIDEEKAKTIKKEQEEFYHELAKKSMVNPSYKEVSEAIKAKMPSYTEGDNIIPVDFLMGLYRWYLQRFSEVLKKNLQVLNSKELGALLHTGVNRPHIT